MHRYTLRIDYTNEPFGPTLIEVSALNHFAALMTGMSDVVSQGHAHDVTGVNIIRIDGEPFRRGSYES